MKASCVRLCTLRLMLCIFSIGLPLAFLVTYGISVGGGYVPAFWPYISDTGTFPVASCFFTIFLIFFGNIYFLIVYIRFKHMRTLEQNAKDRKINNVATVIGVVSASGVHIVASFQETNEIFTHLIGAGMAFGLGLVYIILQTWLNSRLKVSSALSRTIEISMCVVTAIALLFTVGAQGIYCVMPNTDCFTPPEDHHANPYTWLHYISTFSEWIAAFSLIPYFLVFVPSFRKMKLHGHISIDGEHFMVESGGKSPVHKFNSVHDATTDDDCVAANNAPDSSPQDTDALL